MQTFLPYPDLAMSLSVLDSRRLGKQRLEARTILNILRDPQGKRGWRHHPAVLMWQGCEEALKLYYNLCLEEWVGRGYRNNMLPETPGPGQLVWPWWLGRPEFHAAHRASLLRKDPAHYGRLGWDDDPDLPYWWPTEHQGDR
jgi:hypothetical protein